MRFSATPTCWRSGRFSPAWGGGSPVPEAFGIAGFNDFDYMEAAEPSLSSVRTHRWRCGHAAMLAVREMLGGGAGRASRSSTSGSRSCGGGAPIGRASMALHKLRATDQGTEISGSSGRH